jgi:DNA polymerase III subunit epsilon
MILFFDTETTGLPKNWKAPVTDLDNWPRLVQLAYLVCDFDGNLIHSCNEIIKPNGFTIPLDTTNVHGITTDVAIQRGCKIEDVFELFSIHLKRAKVIVAHNMAYDEKIIGSELIRLGLDNILDSKEKICTMESTVDLCKIDGPYGYKWPKLEELHRFLFNHDFDGAHDALADIQATAKCFWELKKQKIVEVTNRSIPTISKSLMEKLKKAILLEENESFDVPFLIIDEDGKESWTLFNAKLEIKHHPFEYHEISEVMISRIPSDENLWNNVSCNVSLWKDATIDPLFNEVGLWTEKWQNWEINTSGELYFRGDIILDIPKLFTIGLIGLNQKMDKVRGFKFYNSEKNISKVIAHYRNSSFRGLFRDGEETVFEEYYFTLFFIDQNGSVFLENNQLEFDPDSCVPFLKIDADGNSSWQFYNYRKDIFFGKIFKDHYEVENELELQLNKSSFFWSTSYTPKYTGHLIELDQWKSWSTNEEGDLFFNEEFKLNLFDLKLDFSYLDGGPILRFLDSQNNISKLIAYCQDGDQDGVYDWYETQFYLNDSGRIYLENNYTPPKEFDIFDAWEAIAEYDAEKGFPDDDFERMH